MDIYNDGVNAIWRCEYVWFSVTVITWCTQTTMNTIDESGHQVAALRILHINTSTVTISYGVCVRVCVCVCVCVHACVCISVSEEYNTTWICV